MSSYFLDGPVRIFILPLTICLYLYIYILYGRSVHMHILLGFRPNSGPVGPCFLSYLGLNQLKSCPNYCLNWVDSFIFYFCIILRIHHGKSRDLNWCTRFTLFVKVIYLIPYLITLSFNFFLIFSNLACESFYLFICNVLLDLCTASQPNCYFVVMWIFVVGSLNA